ncbi:MAG TPA: glycerophosphodiester phosphodiesterase family protein [Bryobacteraceae bacterium]|nr:glycerophosphodiester phosphodiesterase family protein [Bryobacteraceae bacterium]HPT28037.1 glycerophosphodiester phosphodiesterase family protein [Bryobacteraceae bacterium]
MKESAFLLGLSLCVVTAGDPPKWNVRDHIPIEQFTVQSHRGAGVLSPENSIEAFGIAWQLGTVPEADLRTTKDGVIVAFHDNDFKRILPAADPAMQSKRIEDLTWDEVRVLDIGAWKGQTFAGQRVPMMTDMYRILAQHPKRRLYIDIKNVDLVQLARESRKVHNQLILASTDYDLICEWKRLAPRSATLHWMGGTEEQLTARLASLRKANFADITQLQIHVRAAQGGLTPGDKFLIAAGEQLRSHGILFQALPWMSKDPKLFQHLMDLGVASFATDYPDIAMQAIREYYNLKK